MGTAGQLSQAVLGACSSSGLHFLSLRDLGLTSPPFLHSAASNKVLFCQKLSSGLSPGATGQVLLIKHCPVDLSRQTNPRQPFLPVVCVIREIWLVSPCCVEAQTILNISRIPTEPRPEGCKGHFPNPPWLFPLYI